MKAKGSSVEQFRVIGSGLRRFGDLGTKVRNLHKDYKKALAMTLAGKTDAEIVAELKVDGIDEATLKEKMSDLRTYLGIDDFDAPVLRSRPVRRALKEFWIYDFGPE